MTPGFHWTLRPSVKEDDPVLKAFPAELPLLVKQLLLQRGFTGGTETELFLDPRLSHLSDPFLMGEMRAAVERIFQAVDEGEEDPVRLENIPCAVQLRPWRFSEPF